MELSEITFFRNKIRKNRPTEPPPPRGEGVPPAMAYTGRLRPKGVPFSGFRYIKGIFYRYILYLSFDLGEIDFHAVKHCVLGRKSESEESVPSEMDPSSGKLPWKKKDKQKIFLYPVIYLQGTPYNCLYGKAPPEGGTFFRLQVYKSREISHLGI